MILLVKHMQAKRYYLVLVLSLIYFSCENPFILHFVRPEHVFCIVHSLIYIA